MFSVPCQLRNNGTPTFTVPWATPSAEGAIIKPAMRNQPISAHPKLTSVIFGRNWFLTPMQYNYHTLCFSQVWTCKATLMLVVFWSRVYFPPRKWEQMWGQICCPVPRTELFAQLSESQSLISDQLGDLILNEKHVTIHCFPELLIISPAPSSVFNTNIQLKMPKRDAVIGSQRRSQPQPSPISPPLT